MYKKYNGSYEVNNDVAIKRLWDLAQNDRNNLNKISLGLGYDLTYLSKIANKNKRYNKFFSMTKGVAEKLAKKYGHTVEYWLGLDEFQEVQQEAKPLNPFDMLGIKYGQEFMIHDMRFKIENCLGDYIVEVNNNRAGEAAMACHYLLNALFNDYTLLFGDYTPVPIEPKYEMPKDIADSLKALGVKWVARGPREDYIGLFADEPSKNNEGYYYADMDNRFIAAYYDLPDFPKSTKYEL